ncbi:MAG: aminotransferase class V-fold PLP-dependent enzyme, partial [Actinobacteria bacterium]|nr:aminotransferase class V-fold PLP-dependent enzyme [Actinomycetota bacterium]
ASLARGAGIITVLDSVSAVGAEPVHASEWGVDFVAIGGQKSIAGPPNPSAVGVSARGWEFVEANPVAPRSSSLSLLDWRDGWLCSDRAAIPGLPSWLDSRAFIAAIDRLDAEGLDVVHRRHRRAAAASVAGFGVLGFSPWQRRPEARAPIVTTLRLPEEGVTGHGAWGGILAPGLAGPRGGFFRVNHYGRAAALDPVLDALQRTGEVVDAAPEALRDARAAATDAWDSAL